MTVQVSKYRVYFKCDCGYEYTLETDEQLPRVIHCKARGCNNKITVKDYIKEDK